MESNSSVLTNDQKIFVFFFITRMHNLHETAAVFSLHSSAPYLSQHILSAVH